MASDVSLPCLVDDSKRKVCRALLLREISDDDFLRKRDTRCNNFRQIRLPSQIVRQGIAETGSSAPCSTSA